MNVFSLELRRHRAGRDCDSGPRSRLERLVQPRASSSRSPGTDRDVRRRQLRAAADVLRARRGERVGQRLLPSIAREHDRGGVRAQLRRHRPRGHGHSESGSRFERLGTTTGSRSASPARMRLRAWTAACRRSPTPAPIRRTRPCRDRVSTGRGTRLSRCSALSYDATAPTVTGASASRGPDHAGWYNHALLDRLRRGGRDLGDRFLHAGELLGARLAERLGLRHVP